MPRDTLIPRPSAVRISKATAANTSSANSEGSSQSSMYRRADPAWGTDFIPSNSLHPQRINYVVE